MSALGITLDELIASLRARRTRMPAEIGAFVLLESTEALLRGPAKVRGVDLRIGDDGSVSVFARPRSATAEESAHAIIALLANVLTAAGNGVPNGLLAIVERSQHPMTLQAFSGEGALVQLRDELEASLVPLNRAASRRVLARMIRDVKRFPIPAPDEGFTASGEEIDEALDHFLDAPRASRPVHARRADPRPLKADLAESGPLESGPLESRSLESGPLESGPLESRSLESGPLESRPFESSPSDLSAVDASVQSSPALEGRQVARDAGYSEPSPSEVASGISQEAALREKTTRELDELLFADLAAHPPAQPPLPVSSPYSAPAAFTAAPRRPREPTRPYEMERLGSPPREASPRFEAAQSDHPSAPAPLSYRDESAASVPFADVSSRSGDASVRREALREPTGPFRSEPSGAYRPLRLDEPHPSTADTIATDPPTFGGSPLDELELRERPRRGGIGVWIGGFLLVAIATALALGWMRPDLVDRVLGRPSAPPEPSPPSEAELAAAAAAQRARYGTLVVRSEPPRAQVLLFVGRGPATVGDLPLGMAHELIAIEEGYRPARAVVPADAEWESTQQGPRYELAIQAVNEGDPTALGESRLSREVLGSASATLGSVRVITNPPGAKVFLLIGFTPEVRVENVRTDQAIELLIYAPEFAPERHIVGPSDWHDESGHQTAQVDITLRAVR